MINLRRLDLNLLVTLDVLLTEHNVIHINTNRDQIWSIFERISFTTPS